MRFENYVAIILGLAALVSGPLIVRNKVKIFHVILEVNRTLGGKIARQASERSSPRWVGMCGIALTAMGVAAVLGGLFG
jgi:hypothetical protein